MKRNMNTQPFPYYLQAKEGTNLQFFKNRISLIAHQVINVFFNKVSP